MYKGAIRKICKKKTESPCWADHQKKKKKKNDEKKKMKKEKTTTIIKN